MFAIDKLLGVLFITTVLLSSHLTTAKIQTTDRVVATVNKGAITLRELEQKIRLVKHNLRQQKIAVPADDVLQTQVLDRMITDMVQLQYAQRAGIQVDNAQLDSAIAMIAKQNRQTVAQFRATLEKQGYTFDQFRRDVWQNILISRIREREVDNKIFVSEREVSDWIKNQGTRTHTEYELAQILITIPEDASPAQLNQARQKVERVKRELANGARFAAVAAKYSSSPEAMQGGVLGWRASASLPSNFTRMLDTLPIGSITEPIRTPMGLHIFKLINKRTPHTHSVVTQTHVRHILFRINEFVSEHDAMQRARQIKERLQNGTRFEELARLYSEDVSASKGGDMGWVSPGDTVPEFEQAMNQLAPGQISEPIRTQFGIHIISVLDHRQQDIGQDREQMQIRMELKQRKADEQYENWLMQLRESAYVKLHLNE